MVRSVFDQIQSSLVHFHSCRGNSSHNNVREDAIGYRSIRFFSVLLLFDLFFYTGYQVITGSSPQTFTTHLKNVWLVFIHIMGIGGLIGFLMAHHG